MKQTEALGFSLCIDSAPELDPCARKDWKNDNISVIIISLFVETLNREFQIRKWEWQELHHDFQQPTS
jgi:hypothetical protein